MKVIIALVTLTCQLHLDLDGCIEKRVQCVKTLISQRILSELPMPTHEEKLADAFLVCTEMR